MSKIVELYTSWRKPHIRTVARRCGTTPAQARKVLEEHGVKLRDKYHTPVRGGTKSGPHNSTLAIYQRYLALGGRDAEGAMTEVAKELGLSKGTVSHHVRRMEELQSD